MDKKYLILDIETVPIEVNTNYFSLPDSEKLKKLNPIDSKILAIGIKTDTMEEIILTESETKTLNRFWRVHEALSNEGYHYLTGFNIKNFDIPMLTARSFINNVEIFPFIVKNLIDIREYLDAFKYGKTRGKLKEYGLYLGFESMEVDGSDIAKLYYNDKNDIIEKYLRNDLRITKAIFKRLCSTKIIDIKRW